MTKKQRKTASTSRRKSAIDSSGMDLNRQRFLNKMKEFYDNPAVRHIAGGIAVAAMGKFMQKFTERYPEITNMMKNGLDSVEVKLNEFKNSGDQNAEELQH